MVWTAQFCDYEDCSIICVSTHLVTVIAECMRHFMRMYDYKGVSAVYHGSGLYLRFKTRFSPLRYEVYEINGYNIS